MPQKPLKPFLETLSDHTRKLIEGAVEGAISCFAAEGEVWPVIIALPEKGEPKIFKAEHRNNTEKRIVWAFLKMIRVLHPVTILVSEVWYSCLQGKNIDLDNVTPPSQDPNRKEMAMIQVWDEDRNIMITAEIERNPDHLAEFFLRSDTLTKDELMGLGGALQEGDRYKSEDE